MNFLDPESSFFEDLMNRLREGKVSLVFEKKSGERRDMTATLNFDLIPEEHHPKGSRPEPKGGGVPTNVSVFDLDKGQWRSFLRDRVISYERSIRDT